MAKDIVDVAIGEIGYKEQGDNRTKYGAWYGMNGAAWCHMFVSWCANQAGVSTSVVPKTASTSSGMAWFKNKGLFKYKGKYTPKRGDIVYFKTGRSHVGIVEKVSGSTLHTIEGNTSDKVARRTYSLSNATITGYGVPKYANLNETGTGSSTGSFSKTEKKTSELELKYLKKILKKKKTITKEIKATVAETGKLPNTTVTVTIDNGKKKFTVPVEEGMKIVWERKGMPGKLTFEAKYEKNFKIVEGNAVLITLNGTNFFYGFIFTRQMSKDGFMSYTAYDQLRYLKNKDTIIFRKKRADEFIKIIAEKFNMNCGKLENTKHILSRVEENTTLFDMIQDALDETLMVKDKVYVLYDKCGKLRLTNVSDMKVNSCLIDKETGEDFTYKTSIDSEVYNQIKLIYENKEDDKKVYEIYMARDKKNINKWGMLQFLDTIDDPDVGKLKSNALLKLYNKKRRSLTVSGVIGNKNVRAGSLVPIILDLQDIKIANYMLVEKVTHTFKNRQHSMDLILSGGDFSG
ncbi:MAG: CHAP domain-containing protein [Lachnospiraceae bacterium]|nr:CHAP domain-containing protein [Lachnospiraceae bacterium]